MRPITLHLPVKDHGNECGLQGRTKPFPRVKQTSIQKRILWVFPLSSFLLALLGCFFACPHPRAKASAKGVISSWHAVPGLKW